jgi:hypothetical protein
MDDGEVDHLVRLSRDRRLILPRSEIHLLETLKQPLKHRRRTTARFRRLTKNNIVLPESDILRLEFEHAFNDADSPRTGMIRERQDVGVPWSGAPAQSLELAAETLDDGQARTLRDVMHSRFSDTARDFERIKAVSTAELREQLVRGLAFMGYAEAERRVPRDEGSLRLAFPAVGLRRVLIQHAHALEPNDIADLSFICRSVPYLDLVAVDHSMHDLLHRARRSIPEAQKVALFRAEIVQHTNKAVKRIGTMVSEASG